MLTVEERRERKRECDQRYREAHRKELNEKQKAYYQAYRQESIARITEWQKANPDKRVVVARRYRQSAKGKVANRKKNKTPRGLATRRRVTAKRRARLEMAVCDLTAGEWVAILEEHSHSCAYCGEGFDLFRFPTQDHVIPISRGGDHSKNNILPACQSCNSRKGSKLKVDWGAYGCGDTAEGDS